MIGENYEEGTGEDEATPPPEGREA